MKTVKETESVGSYAVLSFMLFMVLVITMLPFNFHIPKRISFSWYYYTRGFFENMFLFFPVGFFFRLTRGRKEPSLCLRELLYGILLSLLVEIVQAFLPGRVTSGVDVIANGIGSWAGALFFIWLQGKFNRKRNPGIFALELPLMNVVYLLIPLTWLIQYINSNEIIKLRELYSEKELDVLNRYIQGIEMEGILLSVLLGIMGAFLLGAVYSNRSKHEGKEVFSSLFPFSRKIFSMLVVGRFFTASFIFLAKFTLITVVTGIGFWLATPLLIRFSAIRKEGCNRYELPCLKRILPVFICFLIILFIMPFDLSFRRLNPGAVLRKNREISLMLFTGRAAALCMLGYLIAQLRGRKNESLGRTLTWVFSICFTASLGFMLIRMVSISDPLNPILFFEALLMSVAALYGGIIYRNQLSIIQSSLQKNFVFK